MESILYSLSLFSFFNSYHKKIYLELLLHNFLNCLFLFILLLFMYNYYKMNKNINSNLFHLILLIKNYNLLIIFSNCF